MTPELEAQMREMYIKEFGERPNSAGSYREQDESDEWDLRLSGWLACARALEPMVMDGEMFNWLCAKHADHDECEWFVYGAKSHDLRFAVLEAMSAALEDGNAE